MKKLLKRIIIVGLILTVADLSVGALHRYLLSNYVKDSELFQTNLHTALFNKNADLLIIGPSTTMHNYVCPMIEVETGMKTLNAGFDGRDVLFSAAIFEEMCKRHQPKVVIMDVTSNYLDGSWHYKIPETYCYYRLSGPMTDKINALADWQTKLKLQCATYRNNCVGLWLFRSNLIGNKNVDGYIPIEPMESDKKLVYEKQQGRSLFKIHNINEKYLDSIVKYCKKNNIKFIMVHSPKLYTSNSDFFDVMDNYCREKKIPFVNYNGDSRWHNNEYYHDVVHMNTKGATKFTKEFIDRYLK